MAIATATLGELTLPVQFSYTPYVPQKRNTVTPTAGAVVVQAPGGSGQIVHGEGDLPWRIEAMYPAEFSALYALYNTPTLTLYEFHGYWGEVYEVYFTVLDKPKVRGRLFEVSGQFQVMTVLSDLAPTCE